MEPLLKTQNKIIAILCYHKIGDPPGGWYTWNYVPAIHFENQLQCLEDNEWNPIDEKQFLMGLENPELLQPKSVLITLDDGYRSNLLIALPILKRFSYPAIVFVPTVFVGGYNAFDADIFYEPREEICSWDELTELEKNNISVQSHGINHSHFSELSDTQQLFELIESKKILERKLRKEVTFFSFPYGDDGPDKRLTKNLLLEAGYKAACIYGGHAFKPLNADRFRLERIAVGADTDIEDVLHKITTQT